MIVTILFMLTRIEQRLCLKLTCLIVILYYNLEAGCTGISMDQGDDRAVHTYSLFPVASS